MIDFELFVTFAIFVVQVVVARLFVVGFFARAVSAQFLLEGWGQPQLGEFVTSQVD